ncbi:MAG: hypothetical protein JEZ07_00810 [Phycisphaerae bacterium]|nr:hypothetical protein [Phycisphaerae bacterium]
MTGFSKDIDLLKYEPRLFMDLAFESQKLCSSNDGNTAGTTFTSPTANFIDSGIKSGHVIFLQTTDMAINNCFEIVSVNSNTELTISVLRSDSSQVAAAVPTATAINWSITTYDPQAHDAAAEILRYFDINEGQDDSFNIAQIINSNDLISLSVFNMLIYLMASIADTQPDSQMFWDKSSHYRHSFGHLKSKVKLLFDTDNDGQSNHEISGGSIRLKRS